MHLVLILATVKVLILVAVMIVDVINSMKQCLEILMGLCILLHFYCATSFLVLGENFTSFPNFFDIILS